MSSGSGLVITVVRWLIAARHNKADSAPAWLSPDYSDQEDRATIWDGNKLLRPPICFPRWSRLISLRLISSQFR